MSSEFQILYIEACIDIFSAKNERDFLWNVGEMVL